MMIHSIQVSEDLTIKLNPLCFVDFSSLLHSFMMVSVKIKYIF